MREGEYRVMSSDLEHVEHRNMPCWARSEPLEFWRAADQYERSNGRLYTEIEVALPRELSSEQRVELARSFAEQELGKNHPYTLAVHNPRALDGGEQPHMHLMFSERRLDGIEREAAQFFSRANSKQPERGGTKKERDWNRRDKVLELRRAWERHANQMLAREGHEARIDCRSLKEQGIARKPEPKLGVAQTAMLMKGEITEAAVEVLTLRQQRIQEMLYKQKQAACVSVRADILWQKVNKTICSLEQELTRVHEERVALGLERFWGVGMWYYPPPLTEEEARRQAYIYCGGEELREIVAALKMREIEYNDLAWRREKYEEKVRGQGVRNYFPHERLRLANERSFLAQEVAEFNVRSQETSDRYEELLTRLSSQPEVEQFVATTLLEQRERLAARTKVDLQYELLEEKRERAKDFAAHLRMLKDQVLLVRRYREGELPEVFDKKAFAEQRAQVRELSLGQDNRPLF